MNKRNQRGTFDIGPAVARTRHVRFHHLCHLTAFRLPVGSPERDLYMETGMSVDWAWSTVRTYYTNWRDLRTGRQP